MILSSINGTFNLNAYEKIYYRELSDMEILFKSDSGYYFPVELSKTISTGGIFGGVETVTTEVTRLKDENIAKELVKSITIAWANEEKYFDISEWLSNHTK